MAEKERMQPFWYQGNLIDPNEELPFPLEQLEAENAWNDMWDAMTEEEQDAYMKAELEQNNKQKTGKKKEHSKECSFFASILKVGSKNETISEQNPDCGFFLNDRKYQK